MMEQIQHDHGDQGQRKRGKRLVLAAYAFTFARDICRFQTLSESCKILSLTAFRFPCVLFCSYGIYSREQQAKQYCLHGYLACREGTIASGTCFTFDRAERKTKIPTALPALQVDTHVAQRGLSMG